MIGLVYYNELHQKGSLGCWASVARSFGANQLILVGNQALPRSSTQIGKTLGIFHYPTLAEVINAYTDTSLVWYVPSIEGSVPYTELEYPTTNTLYVFPPDMEDMEDMDITGHNMFVHIPTAGDVTPRALSAASIILQHRYSQELARV